MSPSAERLDGLQNAGLIALLVVDGLALLRFPDPRTAMAVVLATGTYVLATQLRELSK